MTNKERINRAWIIWGRIWPPTLGERVRVFHPKDLRGRVAKVVATAEQKSKAANRKPGPGKVRVMVKAAGEPMQFNVGKHDVFPSGLTLKQLLTD
jgi:hypothetical protein